MNMDKVKRVLNAIRRVPNTSSIPKGELVIDSGFMEEFMCWSGKYPETEDDLLINFAQHLNLDLVCLQGRDISTYSYGELSNASLIHRFKESGFFVFQILNGSFQTVMEEQGFADFLLNSLQKPNDVKEIMKQTSKEIVSMMDLSVSAGAHGIIIADDIAYNQNTYVKPDFIKKHLLPLWREQVEKGKDLNVPVFLHSDGNIEKILPLVVEAGFDGLQCIEPAAGMDIGKVTLDYGKDLCLMGNIDPSLLCKLNIPGETDKGHDELENTVESLLSSVTKTGGFIFGTCSGLQTGMSPEKVNHMYQLVNEYG